MVAPSDEHAWQLPLPFDLVFDIVNHIHCLHDDLTPTLRSLSATCHSLATICRPLKFERITIGTISDYFDLQPSLQLRKLATLLETTPEIHSYVKHLRVTDVTPPGSATWPYIRDDPDLRYILTRPYVNLRSLELHLNTAWPCLQQPLKNAFESCFSLPTLQKITIGHGLVVDYNFFAFFPQVSELEILKTLSVPHSLSHGVDAFCMPRRLSIAESEGPGTLSTVNIFDEASSLRLSNVEHLVAYISTARSECLEILLPRLVDTLTELEIHVSSVVEYSSTPLDLHGLHRLKNLIISTDVMPQGVTGRETLRRFMWLYTTLKTCPDPNSIVGIKVIIETKNMDLVKCLPWSCINDIFEQPRRWPNLVRIDICINNENQEDFRRYKVGSMEEMLHPEMPNLVRGDLLGICISDKRMVSWSI
ncbi:hypothetical protein CVT26_014089 [Gymnopilus dilepis]|uniref:F-box domain-containing protein n=1 Tax=Gymnopilus dilepis TaxID=231916 RepID=A0A409Y8R8_9AGAR|nr:hypothetical protein CVT26_014089 [Gymnopilus dilepis]